MTVRYVTASTRRVMVGDFFQCIHLRLPEHISPARPDGFIDFSEAFRSRRRLAASKKHHRGIEFRANTSAPLINLN